MTASTSQTGKCRKCGAPLDGKALESPDGLYCGQCRIALAEEQLEADMQKTNEPRKRKWLWPVMKIAILLISIGVIIFQYPKVMTAFEPPKPLHQGSYATDAGTDFCIGNLWLISKGLGEGKRAPEAGMVCPVSGHPYRVEEDADGNRIVNCPDPQRHGMSLLQVSRKNPVPEVRR